MNNQEASQRTFDDVDRLFVEPELQRRRVRGELPENFRIHRCLVLLPQDVMPVVRFNDEIEWEGRVRLGRAVTAKAGDPVFLTQVAGVDTVKPPTVDGKRVAFVFFYRAGNHWVIAWDATPNLPEGYAVAPEPEDSWSMGKLIAESINEDLVRRTIALHASAEVETMKIGLWAAPALMPYPLAAISEQCKAGDLQAARSLLLNHASSDFLVHLAANWKSEPVFQLREQVFEEAVWAHRNGKYTLSVSTLIPHVEGVITEWMHGHSIKVPRGHEAKVRELRNTLQRDGRLFGSTAGMARSLILFLTGGPMLQCFNNWFTPTPGEFPNRHAIGHGKFDQAYFTEDMSVKVFLLLDTLHNLFEASRDP